MSNEEISKTAPSWFNAVDFAEEMLSSQEVAWAIETKCDEYLDERVPDVVENAIDYIGIEPKVENEAEESVERAVADSNIDARVDDAIDSLLLERDQYAEEIESLKCEVSELKEIVSELLGDS